MGKDFLFVGKTTGSNGSTFEPSATTADGIQLDYGDFYASAVLHAPSPLERHAPRTRTAALVETPATSPAPLVHYLYGWIQSGHYTGPKTFDCALSLPRVIALDPVLGLPTWDIAKEMTGLRQGVAPLLRNLTLTAGTVRAVDMPPGVNGSTVEMRVIFSHAAALQGVTIQVRATPDQKEATTVAYQSTTGLSITSTSLDPYASPHTTVRAPAIAVAADDDYTLRIFVDKSVIETHVNAKLSLTTRAYPRNASAAVGVALENPTKTPLQISSFELWGMRSIWAV
jgi:sucrose-6-phosphate hydrolase SacC (GH32 family)